MSVTRAKRWCLGLVGVWLSPWVLSDTRSTDAAVWKQLAQLQTPSECRFQQTKQLSSLSMPLISEGQVLQLGDEGVIWHTQFPIEETLKLTPHTVFMKVDDVWQKQQTPASVAAILAAVLTNNVEIYQQQFAVLSSDISPSDDTNVLRLAPTSGDVQKALASIALVFNEQLERIEITDMLGDTTSITFNDCLLSQP